MVARVHRLFSDGSETVPIERSISRVTFLEYLELGSHVA